MNDTYNIYTYTHLYRVFHLKKKFINMVALIRLKVYFTRFYTSGYLSFSNIYGMNIDRMCYPSPTQVAEDRTSLASKQLRTSSS